MIEKRIDWKGVLFMFIGLIFLISGILSINNILHCFISVNYQVSLCKIDLPLILSILSFIIFSLWTLFNLFSIICLKEKELKE
jgi:hypothetical protein